MATKSGHNEEPPITPTDGRHILIVDDDPDYLLSMRAQLEAHGHRVTSAESVAMALSAVEEECPELAIIDLMINEPDDGFALCYRLKKKHPACPVIMVSAVTSETGMDFDAATEEERAWVKADAFFAKPLRMEQLHREMERLLKT